MHGHPVTGYTWALTSGRTDHTQRQMTQRVVVQLEGRLPSMLESLSLIPQPLINQVLWNAPQI